MVQQDTIYLLQVFYPHFLVNHSPRSDWQNPLKRSYGKNKVIQSKNLTQADRTTLEQYRKTLAPLNHVSHKGIPKNKGVTEHFLPVAVCANFPFKPKVICPLRLQSYTHLPGSKSHWQMHHPHLGIPCAKFGDNIVRGVRMPRKQMDKTFYKLDSRRRGTALINYLGLHLMWT